MNDRNVNKSDYTKKDQGYVLVASLACLLVLSLLGIAAMNTSIIEKTIAQNINAAEKSFFSADGGTEAGIEMVEWNLSCPEGFKGIVTSDNDPGGKPHSIKGLQVVDSRFAYDQSINELAWDPETYGLPAGTAIKEQYVPSNAARSLIIPDSMTAANDESPHINLAIYGSTTLAAGSSVHQAAGYEGKGKGAAAGGSVINFLIDSQKIGFSNSRAYVRRGWKHIVGFEGNCKPYKR